MGAEWNFIEENEYERKRWWVFFIVEIGRNESEKVKRKGLKKWGSKEINGLI